MTGVNLRPTLSAQCNTSGDVQKAHIQELDNGVCGYQRARLVVLSDAIVEPWKICQSRSGIDDHNAFSLPSSLCGVISTNRTSTIELCTVWNSPELSKRHWTGLAFQSDWPHVLLVASLRLHRG